MSLSAEEVYTILCLPAMSQEHVLTSPLSEGRHRSFNPSFYGRTLHKPLMSNRHWHDLDGTCAPAGTSFRTSVQQLASTLKRVDTFYNSIGGLLGYHRKCLQIMLERTDQQTAAPGQAAEEVTFHMPRGPDLAGPLGRQLAAESAAAGLEALPHMAEIYPLGGTLLNRTANATTQIGACTLPYSSCIRCPCCLTSLLTFLSCCTLWHSELSPSLTHPVLL